MRTMMASSTACTRSTVTASQALSRTVRAPCPCATPSASPRSSLAVSASYMEPHFNSNNAHNDIEGGEMVNPFHTLSDWSDDGSAVALSDVQREFDAMSQGNSLEQTWAELSQNKTFEAVSEQSQNLGRMLYSAMQGNTSNAQGNVAFKLSRALQGAAKGSNPWKN